MILTAEMLPLPSIHCGRFAYPREETATLNGVAVPKSRIFSRPGATQDASAEALAMLNAAPVGSVYVITTIRDADQSWAYDDCFEESITYTRREEGWERTGYACRRFMR